MSSTGLLIIDMQNDYQSNGKWPLKNFDIALSHVTALLKKFRSHAEPVFHVRHENPEGAPFFVAGTSGAEILKDLEPAVGEPVIVKSVANAFSGTDLLTLLKDQGITKLIVCGAMSHMCVDSSVRAAKDLGFECTVIHDACATHDLDFEGTAVTAEQVQAAFMAALSFSHAEVCSAEAFAQS